MATICIQCALEAFVSTRGDAAAMRKAATVDETPEEHTRRVHPDLQATRERRRVLEAQAAKIMGGQMAYPDEN